ncbi:MAG: hypothetical protein RLZZ466_1194 [Bacteroidota bacterium]
MKTYSPEDLICYLYNEMDAKARLELEAALQENWTLREKLGVLKTSMQRLDRIVESPRTEVIINILRHTSTHQTQTVR